MVQKLAWGHIANNEDPGMKTQTDSLIAESELLTSALSANRSTPLESFAVCPLKGAELTHLVFGSVLISHPIENGLGWMPGDFPNSGCPKIIQNLWFWPDPMRKSQISELSVVSPLILGPLP